VFHKWIQTQANFSDENYSQHFRATGGVMINEGELLSLPAKEGRVREFNAIDILSL